MLGQASAFKARNQVSEHPPLSKLAGLFVHKDKHFLSFRKEKSHKSSFNLPFKRKNADPTAVLRSSFLLSSMQSLGTSFRLQIVFSPFISPRGEIYSPKISIYYFSRHHSRYLSGKTNQNHIHFFVSRHFSRRQLCHIQRYGKKCRWRNYSEGSTCPVFLTFRIPLSDHYRSMLPAPSATLCISRGNNKFH